MTIIFQNTCQIIASSIFIVKLALLNKMAINLFDILNNYIKNKIFEMLLLKIFILVWVNFQKHCLHLKVHRQFKLKLSLMLY